MALRGNLKDFSLPDVFQLVTFSKKTGVLRIVRADGAEGSVWFRDGEVFFAQSNWHGEPLGERLVHASRITPSALSRALEISASEKKEGRRLGQILVDEGYITDKVLETFVQEQIQDTIFDLMRWDEGEFDFELLPEVVHEDIGLSVSIENIVMEGSRRLEEWARIKKKIPSMEIVFKMATAPGEGTFEISLKPIEWNLLLLVDGTRSVSELARETNRTDFEVARIMYGLFSAGLLEVATDEEVEKLRAERVERDAIVAQIRAQQGAVEQQAAQESLERESALAEQAAARARKDRVATEGSDEAISDAASETPVTESAQTAVPRAEPEIPEFLAGDSHAATADDMAVFEEMMGAVLEAPGEPEVAIEPEPEVAIEPEPEVAIESEPEVAIESDVGVHSPMSEEFVTPELAELLEPEAPEPPALADLPEVIRESTVTDASKDVADTDQAAEEGVVTGDLERDLMALGLGELPGEDLLEPLGVQDSDDTSVSLGEMLAEQPPVAPVVDEGVLDVGIAEEPIAADIDDSELTIAEIEALAGADIGATDSADVSVIEPGDVPEAADLSQILESLDEGTEIVQTESLDDDIEGSGERSSGGVISTDAFLADIAPEELSSGLSGGLGAELSALTGAGGTRRPAASVNKIPEPGQGLELHRDQTVDKELLMKIIKGIEEL